MFSVGMWKYDFSGCYTPRIPVCHIAQPCIYIYIYICQCKYTTNYIYAGISKYSCSITLIEQLCIRHRLMVKPSPLFLYIYHIYMVISCHILFEGFLKIWPKLNYNYNAHLGGSLWNTWPIESYFSAGSGRVSFYICSDPMCSHLESKNIQNDTT